MIVGDLRNKVDSIWNTIWTGGITNPITAVEQITYLMFIKLIDDNQQKDESKANSLGIRLERKIFGEGVCVISENPHLEVNYEDMRWHVFHNFDPETMFRTVRDYIFPFIKTIGDSTFSKYMDNATFLIPTPLVLSKIVDGIDAMDMNNKDIMGDVYEYLLSKIAASGKNGQFRTPRHIINMIIELMQPTLNDNVLDPAMGSAGFLLSSIRYVGEHQKDDLMVPEKRDYYRSKLVTGFDTDQSMLRIGAMNLMLHGVDSPNIKYQDSLSNDNTEREAYSMIMANPPFAGSLFSDQVSKDLLSLANTKKTELLFVALFIEMLKVGGRCASIVPDGVLFGSSNAHKSLRKELVENQKLIAVISMPSGVFKPYAGVSTAILIFTKTNTGGTDKVWFYDMKADGFSLDDKRASVKENDIPDIIERFHNLNSEEDRKRTDQSFFVPKEEITKNGYDLSINKYKEIEYDPVEYPPTSEILADIEKLDQEVAENLAELKKLLNETNSDL